MTWHEDRPTIANAQGAAAIWPTRASAILGVIGALLVALTIIPPLMMPSGYTGCLLGSGVLYLGNILGLIAIIKGMSSIIRKKNNKYDVIGVCTGELALLPFLFLLMPGSAICLGLIAIILVTLVRIRNENNRFAVFGFCNGGLAILLYILFLTAAAHIKEARRHDLESDLNFCGVDSRGCYLDDAKALLKANPDLAHLRDRNGSTILHSEAQSGNRVGVELLLANGADVDAKRTTGDTPLHDAISEGRSEVVDLLLAHKANVNARLMTASHLCMWRRHKTTKK